MTFSNEEAIAAILPPFEYTEIEKWMFLVGTAMLGIGLLFVVLSTVIEYCIINRQVYRTMVMHDAMIRPPRCESKAREVGMETGTNWKHFFYREEPFYEA